MTESQPPSSGATSIQRPSQVMPVPLSELMLLIGVAVGTTDNELPPASGVAVTGVSLDSRSVQPGDLYLALPGERVHGANFTAAAVDRGAVAIVTDPEGARHLAGQAIAAVPVIAVEDPRSSAGVLARRVYQHPPMDLFGLTGTNGKTTTSYLIRSILAALGRDSGLIGTIEMLAGDTVIPSTLTTPEATDVHALIALMAEKSLDAVVMEVSSHALAFGRVDGLVFDIAGFTNLTQDHLDLHGTMAEYAATKARLFSPEHSRAGVVIVDDVWGRWISDTAQIPVLTLATDAAGSGTADWQVSSAVPAGLGWQIDLRATKPSSAARSFSFRTSLPGEFNVANAALAVLMVFAAGVSEDQLQRVLDEYDPLSIDVPGRMQLIGREPVAVVDFAHNPDALQRAMDAVRPGGPGRLITVFGATGQRDQSKRPLMGALAARGSDVVIVTDDDPHDEDAGQIREQVLTGAQKTASEEGLDTVLLTVAPRAAAIEHAVALAAPGDAILVAGRGHEHWQEVRGVNLALDDREELRSALRRHGFTPELVPGIES